MVYEEHCQKNSGEADGVISIFEVRISHKLEIAHIPSPVAFNPFSTSVSSYIQFSQYKLSLFTMIIYDML